jgi:hypothetical protein
MSPLFATMSFDDEDPDLHAHFTSYAHALDTRNPVEFVRALRTLEESLETFKGRVVRSRQNLELRLTVEAETQEATRGEQQG